MKQQARRIAEKIHRASDETGIPVENILVESILLFTKKTTGEAATSTDGTDKNISLKV